MFWIELLNSWYHIYNNTSPCLKGKAKHLSFLFDNMMEENKALHPALIPPLNTCEVLLLFILDCAGVLTEASLKEDWGKREKAEGLQHSRTHSECWSPNLSPSHQSPHLQICSQPEYWAPFSCHNINSLSQLLPPIRKWKNISPRTEYIHMLHMVA